ncbi:hypothetical protein GCM10007079_46050 [Nocardiopsis terrae]|uniref:Uncharacterized protein n=1 Tax=Nocardiopsis terrae TaxID=372655 RepID=A0ABR9HKP4_9ACTN|nr:hypothetical protein [Nocardiopsis terrae]MBE1459588.1 hypothetical protein [Nocardiopsis terrae]GHC94968.1 hypothetical protein GCM10007079_46050 [Nocardiopsis terrae]
MKFEFTPEQEWDSPPDPDPGQDQEGPPSPAALIAAAGERLHLRTRTDLDRLHTSLNRMLYTVEAARPQPEPPLSASGSEQESGLFRPEVFGPRPRGGGGG